MSSFGSLSTALSALYAQRRSLDTTGQNIANANTPGYTRQRVDLAALGAPAIPSIWSTYAGAGSGVTATGTSRLRDMFLEARGQTEHARLSYLQARNATLTGLESTLGEPGDTGLQAQLATYWANWHDVANNPGNLAARSQLVQQAGTITTTMHNAAGAMASQWDAQREQLGTLAAEVTTTAAQVADLNLAIVRASQAGTPANELADRRDLLVMQLADLVGATTRTGTDGAVDVYLGGTALVRGSHANGLKATGPVDFASRGSSSTAVALRWTNGGYPADVTAGQAGGMLESLNTTIPGALDGLDTVAVALVTSVNNVHVTGWDLTTPPDVVTPTGTPFFAGDTASTIQVLITDPRKVAASAVPPGTDPVTGDPVANLDGSNAAALAELPLGGTGSPDAIYRQFVVKLGVTTQTSSLRLDTQTNVTTTVDSARDAEAGVSLDEEMVNMMASQQAYAAAARMLTAVDETLDVLINRTGLVGR